MNDRSRYYVDEHAVRLIAFAVAVLAVALLVTHWVWLGVLLAVDFFVRAFTRLPSPLAVPVRASLRRLNIQPKPIFAPPKRFAAGLGFFFSLATVGLLAGGYPLAAGLVGALLIVCAVLESVFGVCLGCYVYSGIVSPVLRKIHREKP